MYKAHNATEGDTAELRHHAYTQNQSPPEPPRSMDRVCADSCLPLRVVGKHSIRLRRAITKFIDSLTKTVPSEQLPAGRGECNDGDGCGTCGMFHDGPGRSAGLETHRPSSSTLPPFPSLLAPSPPSSIDRSFVATHEAGITIFISVSRALSLGLPSCAR